MKRGPIEEDLEDLDGQGERKDARLISYDDFISFCENGDLDGVNDAIASLSMKQITKNETKSGLAQKNEGFIKAARNGHLVVVNRLLEIQSVRDNILECYYEYKPTGPTFNSAFDFAVKNGHIAVVNRLLEFQEVVNKIENRHLTVAAGNGHIAVVNRLLELQEVVDNVAACDNNALRQAAGNGHLDVVNRLLEFQTVRDNVAAVDTDMIMGITMWGVPSWGLCSTALDYAARGGYLDIVNRLLEFQVVRDNIAENYAFKRAAEKGHLDIVNRLLEFQAVRDNIADNNNEALAWAAGDGRLAVVNRLLEFQAVRDNITANNNGALRAAARKSHLAVVERLLEIDRSCYNNILEADFPEVYEAIGNRRVAKGVAVKALNEWNPSENNARIPLNVKNKILTFAFHADLCGKEACTDPTEYSQGMKGESICTIIDTLRQRFERNVQNASEPSDKKRKKNHCCFIF